MTKIPKTIHQLCFPSQPSITRLYGEYLQQVEEYTSTNLSDYTLKRWSFDEIVEDSDLSRRLLLKWHPILKRPTIRTAAIWADIFRQYVLFQHGGIYLDCDCTILKPFDDLLQYSFVANHNSLYYNTDIILCEPQNVVSQTLVDIFLQPPASFIDVNVNYSLVVYSTVLTVLKEHVTVLRLSANDLDKLPNVGCYVYHHFVHSWQGKTGASI